VPALTRAGTEQSRPAFRAVQGWDTTAFELYALEPNKHSLLRFVVPTLRKEREGWGTLNFVVELNLDNKSGRFWPGVRTLC
jgi:hypothetical protein